LSKATVLSTLNALKSIFHWLAGQPEFRSRLSYADVDYFNLSETETRIAKAQFEPRVPTLEQVLHVIRNMTASSEIELRNRALNDHSVIETKDPWLRQLHVECSRRPPARIIARIAVLIFLRSAGWGARSPARCERPLKSRQFPKGTRPIDFNIRVADPN